MAIPAGSILLRTASATSPVPRAELTVRGTTAAPALPSYARWQNLTSGLPNAPSPRHGYVMEFDPTLGATVLFGGEDTYSNPLGDTWEFLNGSWVNVSSDLLGAPSPRWGAGMVYDPALGELLLFGGRACACGGFDADTWTFSARGWQLLSPVHAPPATTARELVYDANDSYVLAVLATPSAPLYPQYWTFQNGDWTNRTGTVGGGPAGGLDFAVADDPDEGDVVFFGGNVGASCGSSVNGYALTYTYSKGTFTNRTGSQNLTPDDAMGPQDSMDYDPNLGGVVMFGGMNAACERTNSTYLYRNGTWSNLSGVVGTSPVGRWDGRMVYDASFGGELLFGANEVAVGGSNYFINDTWGLPTGLGVRGWAAPYVGPAPVTVSFTGATVRGTGPLTFQWSFGDASSNATTENTSHLYMSNGTFQATLRVSDSAGEVAYGGVVIFFATVYRLGENWTNISAASPSAPTPRHGYALAYDPALGVTVLFGGENLSGNPMGDTWEFSHGGWTNVNATLPVTPAARWGAGVAYDPAVRALVLFGGRGGATTFYGDTWTFNASGWTELSPANAPPAGTAREMVYDSTDGYVLLVLNPGTDLLYDAYWTFQAGTWTNVTASVRGALPSGPDFSVADDPADAQVVFFGGNLDADCGTGSEGLALTYTYAGGTFDNRTSNQTIVPTDGMGSIGAMTYDPNLRGVLMFSGMTAGCAVTNQTYLFQNNAWTGPYETNAPTPPGQWDGRMVYDASYGGDLLFGANQAPFGGGDIFGNSTWTLDTGLDAGASAVPLEGVAPFEVNFSAAPSRGVGPYEYNWSFGDGSANATSATASHVYAAGSYVATLSVTDRDGREGAAVVPLIAIRPLVGSASAGPQGGDAPLPVQFVVNTTGGLAPLAYRWTFGDGSTLVSTGPRVAHTYTAFGTFDWSVNVTSSGAGSLTLQGSVLVDRPLEANVSATPLVGRSPLSVTFNASLSFGDAPYDVNWSFGDGSPNATGATVNHTYDAPGRYTATMTVTDQGGGRVVRTLVVEAVEPLTADVSANPTGGPSPLSVSFRATPSGGLAPFGYFWQFGPGLGSSLLQDPTFAFPAAGDYRVEATINDSSGQDWTDNLTVEVDHPLAVALSSSSLVGVAPFAATFHATTLGGLAPLGVLWSFGDGGTATGGLNQTHTFARPGHYAVAATVTDGLGARAIARANVTVVETLAVSATSNLSAWSIGAAGTLAATATGGLAPFRYSWSGLPPGCAGANTSSISCSPTASGSYTAGISVSDALGEVANTSVSLSVAGAPSTGPAPASSGFSPTTVALAAVGGILIGAVVVALVLRRRQGGAPEPPRGEAGPPEPPS